MPQARLSSVGVCLPRGLAGSQLPSQAVRLDPLGLGLRQERPLERFGALEKFLRPARCQAKPGTFDLSAHRRRRAQQEGDAIHLQRALGEAALGSLRQAAARLANCKDGVVDAALHPGQQFPRLCQTGGGLRFSLDRTVKKLAHRLALAAQKAQRILRLAALGLRSCAVPAGQTLRRTLIGAALGFALGRGGLVLRLAVRRSR